MVYKRTLGNAVQEHKIIAFSWPKVSQKSIKNKQESRRREFENIWGEEPYSLIISLQRNLLAETINEEKYTE